jgi:hypothetical protein
MACVKDIFDEQIKLFFGLMCREMFVLFVRLFLLFAFIYLVSSPLLLFAFVFFCFSFLVYFPYRLYFSFFFF